MGHTVPIVAFVLAAAAVAAACNADPVHTNAVNALGPEVAGIPKGQYHRAGQPCATCHGDEGPANVTFTIAGTVFFGPANNSPPVGVGNATVTLLDDSGSKFTATTNCVGNFFVHPGDWPGHPQFPVLVTVSGQPEGQTLTLSMQSHIGRAASCAECHQYPTTDNYFQTPGLIRMSQTDDPKYQGDQTCPVNPVPPGFGGP
jgi:cytochrome c553